MKPYFCIELAILRSYCLLPSQLLSMHISIIRASLSSHTVTVRVLKLLKFFYRVIDQMQLMASQIKHHKYCTYYIPDIYSVVLYINEYYKHCISYRCCVTVNIDVARIFDWGGGANHKSHAMTSSEIFKRRTFCGTKIS